MFYFKLDENSELRLLERRHAEEVFSLTDRARNHLRKWLPWVDVTQEIKDSEKYIESGLERFSKNDGFEAGIWYEGELAGVIGLHRIDWSNKSTSVGYWLGEEYQGKGLMIRASQAVIEHCFNELDLQRIEIKAATENYKSQALPQKLGFQKEGCIRKAERLHDSYVDHYIFGLLKEGYHRLK